MSISQSTKDDLVDQMESIVMALESLSAQARDVMAEAGLDYDGGLIEARIDEAASDFRASIEDLDVGPLVTYFNVPASIRVEWDRETGSVMSAYLQPESQWSPSGVEDEYGEVHPSDDNQCSAWRSELMRYTDLEVTQ